MEAKATLRHVLMSPQKVRLVADLVRGKHLDEALNQLRFSNKKAARFLSKVIRSAMANAERDGKMDLDNVYVKTLMVDGGAVMKRFMPRAMGRATKIHKRTSHIFVSLEEK
ncbi:MAG: 50S ribosomal protein L22 [Deltaproteobacteria bacterium RIFOXYA12_FULL_61_11]|nr:MAG: 50S ribosomal protein L22 [Deltaproteobacteria bacterium RIFOXYA12_FULL_61_11]